MLRIEQNSYLMRFSIIMATSDYNREQCFLEKSLRHWLWVHGGFVNCKHYWGIRSHCDVNSPSQVPSAELTSSNELMLINITQNSRLLHHLNKFGFLGSNAKLSPTWKAKEEW